MQSTDESSSPQPHPSSGASPWVDPEELLRLIEVLKKAIEQFAVTEISWRELQSGLRDGRTLQEIDRRLVGQLPSLLGVPETLRHSLIRRVARGPRQMSPPVPERH